MNKPALHTIATLFILAVLFLSACVNAQDRDPYQRARDEMVDIQIRRGIFGRSAIKDPRVIEAMRFVPRHRFVPEGLRNKAYSDSPLPIGHAQTISQPYIVALMTEAIRPKPKDRVLEVGTGSGYQAAVLSRLVEEVYTIEIVRPLGLAAAALLKRLDYTNIKTRIGDGYQGWPEAAPFDAIIVTAAPERIPQALVEQLRPGGRMAIPIGRVHETQTLVRITKDPQGETTEQAMLPVAFVPMVSKKPE